MKRAQPFVLLVAFLSLFVGIAASAQSVRVAGSSATAPQTAIRSFDISDLVRTNGQYPFDTGSRPLGIGPVAPAIQPASAIRPEALIALIQSTISPQSWRSIEGGSGNLHSLGTILVVEQTKDNLDQIQHLLDDLRKIVGPMQVMTVHATWVLAQPGALPKVMTEASDEWMAKQKIYCESQLTCFSGQVVRVSSGNDRLVASDITPIVASNAVAFDPTLSVALTGVAMQILPQVVPGSDEAIIDVRSIVSQQGTNEPPLTAVGVVSTPPSGEKTTTANVDRINVISQEFRTTARVPLKKRTIVGGMTLNPAKADDQGTQLYLVIEVTAGK